MKVARGQLCRRRIRVRPVGSGSRPVHDRWDSDVDGGVSCSSRPARQYGHCRESGIRLDRMRSTRTLTGRRRGGGGGGGGSGGDWKYVGLDSRATSAWSSRYSEKRNGAAAAHHRLSMGQPMGRVGPYARRGPTRKLDVSGSHFETRGERPTSWLEAVVLPEPVAVSRHTHCARTRHPRTASGNRQKGFYIYRGSRLSEWRLEPAAHDWTSTSKLARIAVEMPPGVDEAFRSTCEDERDEPTD